MESVEVKKTGKHVDQLVVGLIEAADDKNSEVQSSISDSLFRIGKRHVNMVLSSCLHYIVTNMKELTQGHRVTILRLMEKVLREMVGEVDDDVAASVVKQAATEMIVSKDIVPDWQGAASDLLVAAGIKHTYKVMKELMTHLQPGVLPHYFVVLTMGKLAMANPYDMVPFITGVIGTMLPLLGMVKQENMKWVFAHSISKFAEAIVYYVENLDQAPDKNVTIAMFSNEFYSAYNVLFSAWLPQARDKLRVGVVRALGQISYIISKENLNKEMNKLLSTILSLYKKHQSLDHLAFTESVCMVLDSATQDADSAPDLFHDNIIAPLHTFICAPIDVHKKEQITNQNELLRCFAMINRVHSDKLVANLLQRLEQKDEKVRAGALLVIKHLINSGGEHMEGKKALIISGLRVMTEDPSLKVRRVFAQTIISMAHHGYLELDGGELMIQFIIKQCTLPAAAPLKKPADADHVSPEALRLMCESVLQLIVNTIDIMEQVLWPYLLEFIIPVQYTHAFTIVCKSLTTLAEKKREKNDADYLIDYEDETNLPAVEQLIARLFVMAGVPVISDGKLRGEHVLSAMVALVPNLHQDLVGVWTDVIPKLLSKLEEFQEEDTFSQKKWDDLILRLLSTSLNAIDDENWAINLGNAFGEQLSLYKDFSVEKGFCLKCIGVVMRKVTRKEFIQVQMNLMFDDINHQDTVQQEGLAIALGYTAASHLDSVLAKLEEKAKPETGKKSSGFLGFIKDKVNTSDSATDVTPCRLSIILAYGYVCFYAPTSLVTSRIEANVFRSLSPFFSNLKDLGLKRNMIATIEYIAKTVHSDHLHQKHQLTQRQDLITYLMEALKKETTEKLQGDVRRKVFTACSELVKLEPALPEADSLAIITSCLKCLLPLPLVGVKGGKTETYEHQVEQERLMEGTLLAFDVLLQQILIKDFSAHGLNTITKHLMPWLASVKDNEREKAVCILRSLIDFYLTNIKSCEMSTEFNVLGELIGRLVPRCTDPTIAVRENAILAIQALLRVQLIYEGGEPGDEDKMVDALPILKDRLQKSESTILFGAVKDLGKVLVKKVPSNDQFTTLIDVLIEGLSDAQALCSNGSCVVLNSLVKNRGVELDSQVEDILAKLHYRLPHCIEATTNGALRAVMSLASHHLDSVLQILLTYPLPYDSVVVQFLQVIGKEPTLADQSLASCLEILSQSMPYEEKTNPVDKKKTDKIATPKPLAIVMAVRYMLVPEAKEAITKHYPQLFTALLLKLGSYSGALSPTAKEERKPHNEKTKATTRKKSRTGPASTYIPMQVSVEAMQALIQRTGNDEMLNYMEDKGVWNTLCSETEYLKGIEQLARILAKYNTKSVGAVIDSLSPSLSSLYESDRIVTTAFFGQLIQCRCGGNMSLVEVLVGCLMGRLVDTCITVRQLCVRGLGNIADTNLQMVQKYSTTIISALVSAMDDRDDFDDLVTGEAMTGLSKILAVSADESHVRPILINIALKVKPCFSKNQTSVRAAALRLFGTLAKFGNGPSAAPFLEQIHSNLTALLLHLNDNEEEVRSACKHSLKLVGPLMHSEGVNGMFQKYLLDSAQLRYGEFMNDLCKILVVDLKEKVPFFVSSNVTFFKSQWAVIRCNAAMYLGFLMNALPEGSSNIVNQDHVCSSLLTLLKDRESPEVRSKAAEAISLLTNY